MTDAELDKAAADLAAEAKRATGYEHRFARSGIAGGGLMRTIKILAGISTFEFEALTWT